MSKLNSIFLSRDLSLTFGVERKIWLAAVVFVIAQSAFEAACAELPAFVAAHPARQPDADSA